MNESIRDSTIWTSVRNLGPRARVALALAIVEQMETVLQSHDAIVELLRQATDTGWRWVLSSRGSANDLYVPIPMLLERVYDVESDDQLRSAIFAALSALYYAVWEIDRETPSRGRESLPPLPGDVAESSIDMLRESLDYMNRALPDGSGNRWAASTMEQLLELERNNSPFTQSSIARVK